jgi:hypothetical protein
MEAYINAQSKELADREDMLDGIRMDDDFLDADEPFTVENPVFEDLQQKPEDFDALYWFTVRHFQVLYHKPEAVLYVAKRGRTHIIGVQNGFFLFLH